MLPHYGIEYCTLTVGDFFVGGGGGWFSAMCELMIQHF